MTDPLELLLLDAVGAGHETPDALAAALRVPPERVAAAVSDARDRGLVTRLDRPEGTRLRLTERGAAVVRLREDGHGPTATSGTLVLRLARTWLLAGALVTLLVTVVTLALKR